MSLLKINKINGNVLRYLIKGFSNDSNLSLTIITNNLDNLINNYSFKENSTLVYKDDKPKIYLYNTHDLEKYKDNTLITKASESLNHNLTNLGIEVILEKRKVSELLHTGLTDYDISRTFIKDIQAKEKNIIYYIDIHRDSAKNTTITINEKKYAKILFVLGQDNKNYIENKKILSKMNDYLNNNYPGISKGISEKKDDNINRIYNQDLGSNVVLIEIGGIENTIDEVNNTTEIISLMIYNILNN